MNIIETTKDDNVVEISTTVHDVEDFLSNVSQYTAKNEKYKEIIKFLIKELKRISEFKNPRDIEKYIKAINFYILEDMGLHHEAMNIKIDFYLRGGKFPFLPMVNLFSFYY